MSHYAPPTYVERLLPTALGTQAWELYLLIVALLQPMVFFNSLCRHSHFKFASFKNAIRTVAFIFMFLRFGVTLAPIRYTDYGLAFTAGLAPLLLQFTHFSICVLFVIWTALKTYNMKPWIAAVGLGVVLTIFWIVGLVAARFISAPNVNRWTSVIASTLIGLFGSVQGMIAYWAYKMMKSSLNPAHRLEAFKFMVAITLLLFCAVIRCIWNVSNLFGVNPIDDLFTKLLVAGNPNGYSIFLVYYCVVEAFPVAATTIVLAGEDDDSKGSNNGSKSTMQAPTFMSDDEDIEPGHTITYRRASIDKDGSVETYDSYTNQYYEDDILASNSGTTATSPTTPTWQSPRTAKLHRFSASADDPYNFTPSLDLSASGDHTNFDERSPASIQQRQMQQQQQQQQQYHQQKQQQQQQSSYGDDAPPSYNSSSSHVGNPANPYLNPVVVPSGSGSGKGYSLPKSASPTAMAPQINEEPSLSDLEDKF